MKFSDLNLHPSLMTALAKVNFTECTPIQETAIPVILGGRDVAGLAQTGTGKTAAFLLPLIDRILRGIENSKQAPSSEVTKPNYFIEWQKSNFILVLVPTRELAEQVFETAKTFLEPTGLSAVAVYGGTSYDKQKGPLSRGVQIVIATPGRLIDLYKEHIIDLRQVRAVVFDEADRMFDMGFKDDMKFILRRIPRERQFLVFSATLNFDVLNVSYEFGAEPVEINISKDQPKAENVKDWIFHVGQFDKPQHLLSLIKKHEPRQAIVFSNFKRNVERITQFLNANNVPAMGISSLLTQGQRNRVMSQFKAENDRNLLVATDVAARGLDILGVDMVINFDLPDDPENYVHRIGRTGRAGQTGQAFSLVSDRDVDALGRIEQYLGHKVEAGWLENSELLTDIKPFPSEWEATREAEKRTQAKPHSRGPRLDSPRRGDQRRPRDQKKPFERKFEDRGKGANGAQNGSAPDRGDRHRDRRMGRHEQRNPGPRRDRNFRPRGGPSPRPQSPALRAPAPAKPVPITLGSKVSGFFKRLFSGSARKTR